MLAQCLNKHANAFSSVKNSSASLFLQKKMKCLLFFSGKQLSASLFLQKKTKHLIISSEKMELLPISSEKKIKHQIISSEKTEPRHRVINHIKYEVVNNVTQHRLNQKSQYLNAMMKTNLVATRHFNQPR